MTTSDTAAAPGVDSGLVCLLLLARFFDLPVDGEQLRHAFGRTGRPFDRTEILRAAGALGLKAGATRIPWPELAAMPLPAVARCRDGRFVVVAQVDGDRVLLHDPHRERPLAVPRAEFEQDWCGELLLFTRRAGPRPEERRFDFSWFLPAIVKYRKLLGEVLIASFFLQLFALLTPLFFQVVVDKVLVHKGLTTLQVLGIGMVVLALFEVTLSGLRAYLFAHTTSRIDVGLGAQLFRHLLRLPLGYFETRRVGDSIARVRELENIRAFLTGSSLTVVLDLLFMAVFLAVMFYYSPRLTGIVLGSLPCYLLLSLFVTPRLRARLDEKFNRGAENQAFLVEAVSGVETVKAMAVEPALQRRWEEQLAGYVRAGFRSGMLNTLAGQGAGLINKLTTIAIIWAGAHLVMAGRLTIGQLVAFNMLAGRVGGPVLRLAQLWQDFQQAGLSVRRLGDILNTRPEPAFNPNRATLPALTGRIVFDQVSFRYRPDTPEVLRRLSLDIAPGQTIGLVGRSGSGKSTLTKLIQRLYVPESGRVLVDGVDLAQLDPSGLRRQIGVVLQENFLFNRSIRENIALADPAIPLDRVIRAAQLAGAHDFILETPEGYDTLVGEHGCSLSGGQRQRLAIARALVTEPRILILDEATSALDYESEHLVQRNLARIRQGRTVVIIAHRLSTVRAADRIHVIDRGQIVESGTYQELLRQGGAFAQLHRHQEGLHAAVA